MKPVFIPHSFINSVNDDDDDKKKHEITVNFELYIKLIARTQQFIQL